MLRFTAIAAALLLALPAAARPLETAEAKTLDQALSAYLAAIEKGDATRIVGAIPPRILALFAAQSGMDVQKLEHLPLHLDKLFQLGSPFIIGTRAQRRERMQSLPKMKHRGAIGRRLR